MKFFRISLALLATALAAAAQAPATNAATAPAPATNAAPEEPLPTQAPASTLKLDDYFNELAAALKLTDFEKSAIEAYYYADGDQLKTILNNDALSPLQKAQQVASLRDARNDKISEELHDIGRQAEFLKIEAKYRVALTELAADGGLVAPPPPAK